MNKAIPLAVFIVVAGAVIYGGTWYADKLTAQSDQSQVAESSAATQASAAQAEQQQQQQQQAMKELKITDTKMGTGAVAANGDTVSVLYTGSLDNGTVFDASSKHGNQPFSFVLGAQQVIAGWDLGVAGMKVGGTRELVIPSDLGYGPQGMGPIPPNATLHFTVQLLGVSSTATGAGQ